MHWFPFFGSHNWSDLAGDEGWRGWGEAWGGGPWRAGKGGDGGGAPESSVGATRCTDSPFWAPLKRSDLAGDEGGGMGGGVGRWPMEGGQGGRWGAGTRKQCGSNKNALVHFFRLPSKPNNWSDLAGDEGGGMEGGQAPESSVGATKGDEGGGMGHGEVAHGGRAMGDGGEQCRSNKRCTGSPFWAPLKTGQLV